MDTIDVEVVLKNNCLKSENTIIQFCTKYLHNTNNLKPGDICNNFESDDLHDNVQAIVISQQENQINTYINFRQVDINWNIYNLDLNGPQLETCEDESGSVINLATFWSLPSADIFGTWENLIYEDKIKENLLKYATTMMLFAEKQVNNHIISCNKVILLHGPPGTGKTSLCKALAQKLSIKLKNKYKQSILLEINSHSLFSKWFSESGKLVNSMFSKIMDIIEDPQILACVLIDEIESLAHARDKCLSGNEPSDSMRAVNALLTQIDKLKRYQNVIILTTSNLSGTIDLAFVDRADIKQYVGLPGKEAIYQIYHACVQELLKKEIIYPKEIIHPHNIFDILKLEGVDDNNVYHNSRKLVDLSVQSVGLSGRTLRKIPFLAHALFVKKHPVTMNDFFDSMSKAIEYEKHERIYFNGLNK